VQFLAGVDARSSFGPVVVPAGHCFMPGDNRDNSANSRDIGFVPRFERWASRLQQPQG
jgi:signal peptidase I